MKKIILFLLVSSSVFAQETIESYITEINKDSLKKNLTFIASDALGGRDTGSEGQKKAGEYIANLFEQYGLLPIITDENGKMSYFQKFELYKTGWDFAKNTSYLKINNKKYELFDQIYPNGIVTINEEQTAELVFVGYGLEKDYENLDVKNKTIVFLEGDPDDSDFYKARKGTLRKTAIAKKLGAINSIEISKKLPDDFKTDVAKRKAILGVYNRLSLNSIKEKESEKSPFASFVVSKQMGATLLGISPKKIDKYIAKSKKLDSAKIPKIKNSVIGIKSDRAESTVETANIMGFMEGTDKKDEVVVITAHYDHVGTDEKGNIYNGADDDGSGTCAVLELAKAFSKAKKEGHGPRRSILFMTVTGEEKGLLGSKYFTDIDPMIPLPKIVSNLNIDMIGRIDEDHKDNENYVYLIGSDKLSSELDSMVNQANRETVNLDLDYTYNDPEDPNRFYYRSDHYNFAKNNIPVVFFFTGVHEDYHKPTDTVDKILFNKYELIVKLVYQTATKIANSQNRLIIDSNKK